MSLPPDQKEQLWHAAMHRAGMVCTRSTIVEGEAPMSLQDRARQIFDTTE